MSNLFKSKKVEPEVTTVYDPTAGIRNKFNTWLEGQIGKPTEQYKGEFVAPKTSQESESLNWLKKYADQGTSEGMNLANEEVRKTMTGYYDPSSSPYYQAVKAEANRNLEDTLGNIASDAAGGGRYWTGARLGQQREARTDVANSLNTMLGAMAEQERMNRLNTVPIAAQLGQYAENVPLAKTEALQNYGSLDRALQQAQNEAIYNEWLRATQQYPLQIAGLAQGSASQQPIFAQAGYQPSGFSQIAGPLGNILAALILKK